MSVVAVKNKKNEIIIGADSQITIGSSIDKFTKLIKHKENELYYGLSGSPSDLTSYKVFLKKHKPSGNNIKDIHEHFVDFLEFVKSFKGKPQIKSTFLFIYKNKVYKITKNLMINEIEVDDYKAIGSGFREAETALYLGENIKKSIEVACENNIYCNYPINQYKIKK